MTGSDEHAARVVGVFLDVLARFETGETGETGEADIPALQVHAATAAQALDNTHADLRRALARLDNDLELIRFTMLERDQPEAVREATAQVRELAPRPR